MTAPHVVALDRLLSLARNEHFSGEEQSCARLLGDAMEMTT